MRSPTLTTGMFYGGNPVGKNRVISGMNVAIGEFVDALRRHGTLEHLRLYALPWEVPSVQKEFELSRDRNRSQGTIVDVDSVMALLDRTNQHRFSVWHEPASNSQTAFRLRQLQAHPSYPITITHHAISAPTYRHHLMLPLLLEDVRPFDSVVCTSRAMRQAIASLLSQVEEEFNQKYGTRLKYRGRLDFIPLGVDTDHFRPRDKGEARRRQGFPQNALVLLWVGRFSALEKADLLPLLHVFRSLVKGNPKRNLLLVMVGTERRYESAIIRNHANELGLGKRIRILTNLPARKQHHLYPAADIFVSPIDSIQESFGITPIEAMACGVPQVVSDWDGYRDTVRHGETGFRVPSYWMACDKEASHLGNLVLPGIPEHFLLGQAVAVDLEVFRLCIQRLIENDELRHRMGQQSRKRALSCYSWKHIILEFEELWRELSAVAKSALGKGKATKRYYPPSIFQAFRGYPTARLPQRTLLYLTEVGARVLMGQEGIPAYYESSAALDYGLLWEALSVLKRIDGKLHRGCPLQSLVAAVSKSRRGETQRIRRHVMWLLKYGLVQTTPVSIEDTCG